MRVTVNSTESCYFCTLVKEFLQEHNIKFEEVDVGADQKAAQKMIEKSHQYGVPQTWVEKDGKEEIIIGFDIPRLKQALGIK
ncbi:MAG: NrdH-redoxin [Candidatus Aenigmarchaeota archaeon]|nr:NrdH-redoxin [Candidatus Aenigmarchaeota archaeon]